LGLGEGGYGVWFWGGFSYGEYHWGDDYNYENKF